MSQSMRFGPLDNCGDGSRSAAQPGHYPSTWLTRSPQETAGISQPYPDRSEYLLRFRNPDLPRGAGSDYAINPNPDFAMTGRSLTVGGDGGAPLIVEGSGPAASEYGTRYAWPDGKNLPPRPWAMTGGSLL